MAQQIKSNLLDEIDLAERYMVCGLFNEACSLASSQIQKLRTSLEFINEIELSGMMESAGMVFVQSLRESGRTTELFAELTLLFGSVEAIPIQVFLTGVCMQISEGITSDLTPIFEKFFEKWRYVDDDHYAFLKDDTNLSKCPWQLSLDLGKYLEVAEVFAMVLLGRVLCQPELAISWTENSNLPEDKRQDMLRRLRSMCLTANSSSSIKPASVKTVERAGETSSGNEAFGESTNSSSHTKLKSTSSKATNPSFKHLTHQKSPLWWFSTVHLKFGGIHMVLPRGRIVLVGLVLAFASYFLRRRASALRKLAWRQALLIRRIWIDAWQLAFSVHLNPLAAVQQGSLPAPASSR